MKEITAIIRMNQVNPTKKALTEIGINGFHAIKCTGRGKVSLDLSLIQDSAFQEELGGLLEESLSRGGRLIPKRLITVLVPDNQVTEVVQTIIKVNSNGHPGDGRIFVSPAAEVVRTRTGERGDAAL